MKLIGEKRTFGVEIGPYCEDSKQLQHIRVWVGGKCINPIDDVVYLPTFYTKLENEICRLESNAFSNSNFSTLTDQELFDTLKLDYAGHHQVLLYDVSIGAAQCYFVDGRSGNTLLCAYWEGRHDPKSEVGVVFGVHITKEQLLETLRSVLSNLSNQWV